MPIRFRCHHCDQLMGIARRKAGATVRCPSCRESITVPTVGSDAPHTPPRDTRPAGRDDLFDRDDFDVILQREPEPPSSTGRVAMGTPPPPPPAVAIRPAEESLLLPGPAQTPGGLVLSPGLATLLTVVQIVLLALAFVGGLLVGRSL